MGITKNAIFAVRVMLFALVKAVAEALLVE
jgi:hypothetical protein